jgi:hypothetical protein
MMKRTAAGLLWVIAGSILSSNGAAADLSAYRWKNRILVVNSTPDGVKPISHALHQERSGIIDRDLIVINLSPHHKQLQGAVRPPSEHLKSLRSRYGVSSEPRNEFVLIGKDGGIKARQTGELKLDRLFALIDTMPMRQDEIRAKR